MWKPFKPRRPQSYPYPTIDRREDGMAVPGPFAIWARSVTEARAYAEDLGLLLSRDLPFTVESEET
jgi:hypothetical protein